MIWWGKIIGAVFGFLLTGSIFGAFLGMLVGNLFDRGLRTKQHGWRWNTQQQHQTQQIFFKTTFSVMGHVAKADGHISENEIRVARSIMQRMRLTDPQRREAINYFNVGKQPHFNLEQALNELLQNCHQQRILLKMFVEIQYQAAMANSGVGSAKQRILETIYQHLGFSPTFQQDRSYYQHTYSGSGSQGRRQPGKPSLKDAYAVLEIAETANNADIKRAYRKQMSQNHPDKLIAQGLPEAMIKIATDKTQKIQGAYEQIKKARGL